MLMLAGGLLVSCGKMETGESTTFTRWQVPIATDSGGGATAPPCRRQGDRSDAGWHAQPQRYVMDASGNTVPKDTENTIYRKSTTETCVTARTPNADIDQSGGYAGFGLLYVTVVGGYDQPSASVSTTAWQSRVHAHGGRRYHGGKTNEIDVVQTVPGNTWIDGGEENVAVAKTIHYTADEVKAGDYIYSGRSTSDGGLRKRYPNGKAQVIADPKPQSVAGKIVPCFFFLHHILPPHTHTHPHLFILMIGF